ncbi:MAG TPA: ABC transporter substrate-binding protein [Candidatus Dormibacteraeota bacterium]
MFVPNLRRAALPLLIALLAAACGGTSTTAGSPSPNAPTALSVSYSEVIPDELAPWGAADGGYFKKHNLDVTLTSIASANGVAALLSGQVQIAQLGGSEVVSAAAGGGDLVIVANLVPVFPYVFEVPTSISSFNDLKGKKVGVSKVGGSADIATRTALTKNGLDPAKDVTIVETGSAANRVAALRSGAIQGGVSQPPESTTLDQQGFHSIYDLAKQKLPAANTVVATTGTYARQHKAVVQAYIDALVETLARIHKDKAFAEGVLTKWEKITDQALLDGSYTFYTQEVFPQYPYPRPEQYQPAIDVLKKTNSKLASYDVSKTLDPSFVKSANDRKLGG